MKKTLYTVCVCLGSLMATYAQDNFDQLAQLSPKSELSQIIGITNVNIKYYRPDADGRKVWGSTIPYGEVWRAGANFTTIIEFDTDVSINNNKLKAGKYSLFILPEKDNWTFIFDSNTRQFGAFFYSGKTDALRVSVKPEKTVNFETATFHFENLDFHKGDLIMAWGKLAGRLTFSTDRESIINRSKEIVKVAIAEKNQQNIANCVAWAIDNELLLDDAKMWLKASQDIKPEFANQFLEARFYALEGDYLGAIAKANMVAEQFPFFKPVTDSFIKKWNKLK